MTLIISPDLDPIFTSTAQGSVPASGGGTTNFLRADGTWSSPAAGSYLSASTTSTQDGYFTGVNFLEGGTSPALYTRLLLGSDLTLSRTVTFALGDFDRTITFPSTASNITLATIAALPQTFAGSTTFSNATVTVGNSTAASTYGIGTGATTAATTKAIDIGTNGVATSITNITLGSQTSINTTKIYGDIQFSYDDPQAASPYAGVVHYFEPQSSTTAFGTANSPYIQGGTFLNAGTVPFLTLNSGAISSSYVVIQSANSAYSWLFSNAGKLSLPTSIGIINNNTKDWTFDSSGNLTLPASGNIISTGLITISSTNINTGAQANVAWLGTGTANSTTYLRGDGTWATVTGGSGLSHADTMSRISIGF